ncbi:hypothetical protein Agub_g463 [Astrephomene gubernaculifera]|uniref:Uncharacterized protein n=1 Tax=Astrephomene gubernaculifera TaxID=47775 RepID=A0AAD3DEU8_9CHLO|nr:hypothetical protein Agub_g463 [Astrephomene gubernaculifera]
MQFKCRSSWSLCRQSRSLATQFATMLARTVGTRVVSYHEAQHKPLSLGAPVSTPINLPGYMRHPCITSATATSASRLKAVPNHPQQSSSNDNSDGLYCTNSRRTRRRLVDDGDIVLSTKSSRCSRSSRKTVTHGVIKSHARPGRKPSGKRSEEELVCMLKSELGLPPDSPWRPDSHSLPRLLQRPAHLVAAELRALLAAFPHPTHRELIQRAVRRRAYGVLGRKGGADSVVAKVAELGKLLGLPRKPAAAAAAAAAAAKGGALSYSDGLGDSGDGEDNDGSSDGVGPGGPQRRGARRRGRFAEAKGTANGGAQGGATAAAGGEGRKEKEEQQRKEKEEDELRWRITTAVLECVVREPGLLRRRKDAIVANIEALDSMLGRGRSFTLELVHHAPQLIATYSPATLGLKIMTLLNASALVKEWEVELEQASSSTLGVMLGRGMGVLARLQYLAETGQATRRMLAVVRYNHTSFQAEHPGFERWLQENRQRLEPEPGQEEEEAHGEGQEEE